jgi:hypothetical protein
MLEKQNSGYILAVETPLRRDTANIDTSRENPEPLETIRGFGECEEGESNPHGS